MKLLLYFALRCVVFCVVCENSFAFFVLVSDVLFAVNLTLSACDKSTVRFSVSNTSVQGITSFTSTFWLSHHSSLSHYSQHVCDVSCFRF